MTAAGVNARQGRARDRDVGIAVAGAGSIGCYVGGLLAAAGRRVALLGRPRIVADLQAHGLTLTDLDGLRLIVAPERLTLATDPAALVGAGVVLVCTKSGATAEMGGLVAAHTAPGTVVVSLQNGVGNADILRDALPAHRVLAGMVPFNVVQLGGGRFHRGTEGRLAIARAELPPDLTALLQVPGLGVDRPADMVALQWGKLLLNLNNAVNALSGQPLRAELLEARWRRLLADCMAEALELLRAAGIRPARVGRLPPPLLPFMLRLPTPVFRRMADAVLRIDPTARSSMAEDLDRGRPTEVDVLQGAVIDLARRLGRQAPVNAHVRDLVRDRERQAAAAARAPLPDADGQSDPRG